MYDSCMAAGLKCSTHAVGRLNACTPWVLQRAGDPVSQRVQVPPGHDRDIVAEDLMKLEAARVVGREHRCAGRQRLDGHGRECFEQRRQDEEVGHGRVPSHLLVRQETGEGDLRCDSRRARLFFQGLTQRTGTAEDQPHVVAIAADPGECIDEVALARELVETLDVQQDKRLVDAELVRATGPGSRNRTAQRSR